MEFAEILYSFRLVLKVEAGGKIPDLSKIKSLENFSASNFILSCTEDNTSGTLNGGAIADLRLLRTLLEIRQKFQEPSFWEVKDSFVLLAYASLATWRTLLQQLLACLNFSFDSEDLFCWYKQKKSFLWTMAVVQAAENHGDEWGFTRYLQWEICTSVPT